MKEEPNKKIEEIKDKAVKAVRNLIIKAVKKENQAWLKGKRCHSCGKEKEPNLSDTCGDCFENL